MRWSRSPHLHPARRSPPWVCSILGILSEPNDLHGPPKHEGDAGSYHRSGRRAARRRLECAGDTEASNAAAAAAAGDLGVTTRLRASALPSQPSPHPLSRRILRRSLQSPRAGREGEGRGGAPAPRGRIRALVGLIGIYRPNGTTDPAGCTLTDFPSSP